jgi:hypothetical protein
VVPDRVVTEGANQVVDLRPVHGHRPLDRLRLPDVVRRDDLQVDVEPNRLLPHKADPPTLRSRSLDAIHRPGLGPEALLGTDESPC